MSFGLFAPFVHLAPYAKDVGLGEGFGVLLIVLLGVGSTVGPLPVRQRHQLARPRASRSRLMYVGAAVMLAMWSMSTSGRR